MAEPARHLRVVHVDEETGERIDKCPGCVQHETHVSMLERDLAGKRLRIAQLEADRDAEARKHKWWPRAVRLFDIWREASSHLRCEWNAERFWMAVPSLKKFEDYWIERAIAGLVYQPFSKTMRNGKEERYDLWENLFTKNGRVTTANVERYANRAPADFPPAPLVPVTEKAKELADFVLDRARLIEEEDDAVAVTRIFIELDRRVKEWVQL